MQKAFTMIELIFVIIILGVLAAIAIPKFSATRDDAKMSGMMTSISNAASELGMYAVSNVGVDSNLSIMSNSIAVLVNSSQATLGNKSVTIKFDNVDCINISIVSSATNEDLNVSVITSGTTNKSCAALQKNINKTTYNLLLRGGSIVY
ncbi:prepilin-type N-terminal cleavage/methylation domain-containing protein [Sulfurimonas sp. SAG-AH-194-L11]|nr:prepilin-type N-terminal cleavage/methylation domain-containing protein [Sulfurimonas sp. SAG-AH-194-L11]MDF1876591.1 prepilin-type N-terminal cleavage/methylation domain-containing protein [Sulfurimonas sp. SAG-AH-194-L11]